MYRILVVDDEPLFGDYIVSLLRRSGFHADAVYTAQDGLTCIARNGYDAVVTDILMPGMDGIEFIRAIRRLRPRLPVMAMTGAAMSYRQSVMRVMRVFGAGVALPKTIDPERIVADVLALCAARKADAASDAAAFAPDDAVYTDVYGPPRRYTSR